ncbi:MAG TPA: hypothetical protein VK828_14660 [Terriglobales bacterium]|jgi:hypothetical protein|nr:hypothetical protein [Terriglobales bacterium]
MGTTAEPIIAGHPTDTCLTDAQKAAILRELHNVLESRPFRNSARSKQFLSYVVEHKLEGREEFLKERNIGTEIFQRKAGYATGDDPVVRVQAGEVRRRLEQYHHTRPSASPVRIELPLGSYSPEFHWDVVASPVEEKPATVSQKRRLPWIIGTVCLALVALVALTLRLSNTHRTAESALDKFWSPIFTSSQPVLICLAKPVLYRPSLALYQRYSKRHPGTFQTEVERYEQPLLLDPNDKIAWREMVPYGDYGVAMGDVYVAVRLSALFDHINKPSQVRIGTNYSFEDLRNSPAVVIGAFNNHWTLQMTSNLRFAFVEQDGNFKIREQSPSGRVRSWVLGPQGQIVEDFAVVTRLLDSKTGQVIIAAAGLGANGTQAAGEFISRQDYLEEAFRTAPSDWPKKNVQVVVQTTVTDSVAGPPRVIATYFW